MGEASKEKAGSTPSRTELKQTMRALRQEKLAALEASDRGKVKGLRRKIKRVNRRLRAMAEVARVPQAKEKA